jgi:N-acetyl-gamma-glutamyl-phosphate reductase
MTTGIQAAILGASGYGAAELLRLLTQHPSIEVAAVTSTSKSGQPIDQVHPHLRGFYDLKVAGALDLDRLLDAERVVLFSALPHGVSGSTLGALLESLDGDPRIERLAVVDLSGDLRLDDLAAHERYYPKSPPLPQLRRTFVYGSPELFRDELRGAHRVANPGCLASASILAAAPLATLKLSAPMIIDAKTGSSGSGSSLKATTHHPTRHANFRAYKPLDHQHEPEIRQALERVGGEPTETSFVAQSMDATRGIFVTVHLTLAEPSDGDTLRERYENFYADSPFVRLVDQSPELQDVVGSNFCDLAVACRGRQVIAMAAIDNLIKGMAGTAIQNANLMCGLPETTGLWTPSLRPI